MKRNNGNWLLWCSFLIFYAVTTPCTGQDLDKEMFKPYGENTDNCYGKALVPTLYDTLVDKVEVTSAYTYLRRIPPVYDTIVEKILIRPGYTKYEVIEPVFEIIKEEMTLRGEESIVVAAEGSTTPRTITDRIQTMPSSRVWRKTKRKRNCKSPNPDDCLEWQILSLPAQYQNVERSVIQSLASKENIQKVAPEVLKIEKMVLKKAGSVREVDVLPEYKTVVRLVAKTEARFEQVTVPATYQNLQRLLPRNDGGTIEAIEVVCPKDYPKYVKRVQEKLQAQGYDIGTVADGLMGRKTKTALVDFQVKHQLPVGQLDWLTLKKLGIQR